MYLSFAIVDQFKFLFTRLALKAALTDIDYVFVILRPEWIGIDIVYSVH